MLKQILDVLEINPKYGHRRIALALGVNRKKTLRVMKKYSINCKQKRKRRYFKSLKEESYAPNLIKSKIPLREDEIWVTDYTYLSIGGKYIYLSTVLDTYTRQIKSWRLGITRDSRLVLDTISEVMEKCAPEIIHSDHGYEYTSFSYQQYLKEHGVLASMSGKGKPWENGYQESFYSGFKLDLGETNHYWDLGEIIEAVAQTIYYYNNQRIHTKLKTAPVKFRLDREYLFKEMGT